MSSEDRLRSTLTTSPITFEIVPMWSVFQMVVRPHILAIAGLASLVFGWLFSAQFFTIFPAIVAADWFVVNLLNRAVDLPEDAANGVPGTQFLAKHGRWVTIGTIAFF